MEQMKTVKKQDPAVRDDIGDLVTRRALPTQYIDHLDPFLFLNHHGPQVYPKHNQGLPFGPHPHRGFETVTFILKGDLEHQDTGGHRSVIKAGGIQWMTAGRGLVHSEVSSKEFLDQGGDLEILQLWVNLPGKFKMTEPGYVGLQKDQIPQFKSSTGDAKISLISGQFSGERQVHQGPVHPLTDISLMTVEIPAKGKQSFSIPRDHNVFFYVIRGELTVNGGQVKAFHLVEFNSDGEEIQIEALKDSLILLGHAKPYGEPIVSHGPFVMNTREEIMEAIRDYQAGKFN
jgi:redox-sensitive bicupin YhaK (pirin superfamily)